MDRLKTFLKYVLWVVAFYIFAMLLTYIGLNVTGTKYLKIENTEVNVPKKFQVMFTAENVKYYTVEILEDTEETRQKAIQAKSIFEEVFTDEELKGASILALILGLTFLV